MKRPGLFLPEIFVVALLIWAGSLPAQENASAQSPSAPDTAPLVIDGKTLFLLRGVSSYPAETRAQVIRERIIAFAEDETLSPEEIRLEIGEDEVEMFAGDELLLKLLEVDARVEDVSLPTLAEAHRYRIIRAVNEYREDRSQTVLVQNGLFALVATLALVFAVWVMLRLFRLAHGWAEQRLQSSIHDLASKTFHLFHAGRVWQLLAASLRVLRFVLIAALIYFYLNAVLGLFPWTRPFAVTLLALVLTPLKSMGLGLVAALPKLTFLVILVFVVRYLLKLVRAFFNGIRVGRIRFENFDSDWAMPTYKIVRLVIIAFSLVVAYPYIPGSDSLAFKGVSVFLGVLLSLGSTSFIANSIAGMTMTYRGAFREGDLVKIGDVTGRVDDIKLMVTRVRTPKGEEVVLPNSNILNTDVTNYSTLARKGDLLLHSEVGIGYDTPWRKVESMLIEAVRRTDGLLDDPPPFVLQKSLGDFTVNYEVNAAFRDEHAMPRLYSRLHANIQDVFNENGVQIMSPHYVADTETPKIVPPDGWQQGTDGDKS